MALKQTAIFVLGPSALPLAQKIKTELGGLIHGPKGLEGCDIPYEKATHAISRAFMLGHPIIGICASGILIRAVAESLKNKRNEPAVVAVAEDGSSVIPLLGGHHGANDLANKIAALTNGNAAITTASDVMFGDLLDNPAGAMLSNRDDYKAAVAAKLRGEEIIQEVTIHNKQGGPRHLVYHPFTLAVGIGCERGTNPDEVKQLVEDTFAKHNLSQHSVREYGSIDLKEDEPAIYQFAMSYFTAEELKAQTPRLLNPSAVVEDEVGTPSVAEAAALALVGPSGKLLVGKTKSKRATVAIAQAISMTEIENNSGRMRGKVSVVGIGPGSSSMMTPEVEMELYYTSEWVGYSLYLDLIEELRRGQTRHDFPLGDEEARCRKAIELAKQGEQVALVCSGDAGIYAMAALVYELIDLEPCRIAVEVHPGISAFQAASARAGAMIGHDFCCISLSDLLTPWEVIEKRLHAAAEGDFVISFYNPRSLKRRDQLERAFAILKDHRPPDTPVVIASNLGRPEEKTKIVKFADFNPEEVDMLTLVMVGSSQSKSFMRGDGKTYAYTPRGYARKREIQ
jgi:cobalt-precorrin 5A hydrolase / precorrin-3B C17-methyltransferase